MNIYYIVVGICFLISILWIGVLALFQYEIWSVIEFACKKLKIKSYSIIDIILIILAEMIEMVLQLVIYMAISKIHTQLVLIILSIISGIENFIIFGLCTNKL